MVIQEQRQHLWEQIDLHITRAMNDTQLLASMGPWEGSQWDDLTMATDELREAAARRKDAERHLLMSEAAAMEAQRILARMRL